MNEPLLTLLERAASIQRQGRRCLLCLVVGSRGSTPQEPGALMLVDDAAMCFGTIGGGCVEAEVRRAAFAVLSGQDADGVAPGKAMEHRAAGALLRFKLNHDYGWDDGLICGGTLELIVAAPPSPGALDRVRADIAARRETGIELWARGAAGGDAAGPPDETAPVGYRLRIPPRDRLYIAGAGHVGQAVARLALALEFEVRVFDDRVDLLEAALPSGAVAVPGDIADCLRAAEIDAGTYCLVVTRGHRHDEQALGAVVGRGAAYVGMIGSRRKVKLIFDDLVAMGVPAAALEGVRAPVGLDIGAVSVEEIAVSIAAELVRVRRSRAGAVVSQLPSNSSPLRGAPLLPEAQPEGQASGMA
jgi:xanthine dehydrogenase accessory factor